MNRRVRKKILRRNKVFLVIVGLLSIISMFFLGQAISDYIWRNQSVASQVQVEKQTDSSLSTTSQTYEVGDEEKARMQARFSELRSINSETIGYIYAPGTPLDEPIVQTQDNETYLSKTFEGNYEPYFGSVFMDMDNEAGFTDSLTWIFGHVRGPLVSDERIFQTVAYYENQEYFDAHPYFVVQTPERQLYYQAAFTVKLPETTPYYRTEFSDSYDFISTMALVSKEAVAKNSTIALQSTDCYLALSTCRAENDTERTVLFLRQIPDSELTEFLEQNGMQLTYVPTR